jgi:hypothetical protein
MFEMEVQMDIERGAKDRQFQATTSMLLMVSGLGLLGGSQ